MLPDYTVAGGLLGIIPPMDPIRIVTVAEMRAIEAAADAKGWTYAQMMRQAGWGLALELYAIFGRHTPKRALILVGSGNNGGDALVAGRHLNMEHWEVTFWIVAKRDANDPLIQQAKAEGAVVHFDSPAGPPLQYLLANTDMVVDGLLGTGVHLPLSEEMTGILQILRDFNGRIPFVAVDCPSGMDCDKGEFAPETPDCTYTVTMQAVKAGMLTPSAWKKCGEVRVVGIGLPDGLAEWQAIDRELVDAQWVKNKLPARSDEGHKGTFGTVGVLAGSLRYPGAALLNARGAMAGGCGMVSLAVIHEVQQMLAGAIPEAIWLPLPAADGSLGEDAGRMFLADPLRFHALVLGSGWGINPETKALLDLLIQQAMKLPFHQPEKAKWPLVIDADALKILAQRQDWHTQLPGDVVLTPHPGEMAALTGKTTADVQENRWDVCRDAATQRGCTVVLKGAFTVVGAADGRLAVVPLASSALAHAGTGDVLAGLIAALMAQGMAGYEAACCAAWIHGQAGLRSIPVAGEAGGVTAGMVAAQISPVIGEVRNEKEQA